MVPRSTSLCLLVQGSLIVACAQPVNDDLCAEPVEMTSEIVDGPLEVDVRQQSGAVQVLREYRFADRKMFEINRYLQGKQHGIQLLYDLNTSKRPKYMTYLEHGERLWLLFPSADVDHTLDDGSFVKGVVLSVDSAFIRAPFDSTVMWYEGSFVRVNGRAVPVGGHRIYDEQGSLTFELTYDLSHGPTDKQPLQVERKNH